MASVPKAPKRLLPGIRTGASRRIGGGHDRPRSAQTFIRLERPGKIQGAASKPSLGGAATQTRVFWGKVLKANPELSDTDCNDDLLFYQNLRACRVNRISNDML
jgi:hypothetical protein